MPTAPLAIQRFVILAKSVRHETAGQKEVNPRTGKTVRGGQFAPAQGTLISAPVTKLTTSQEKQVERALESGLASISKDGKRWTATVKPSGASRSRSLGAFDSLASARSAVLGALTKDGGKIKAYEDVGEKIGGARKDINDATKAFTRKPSEKGLKEIEALDPAAASRLCRKQTLWKPQSLDEMQDAGYDPAFAYAVHALYSLVDSKPKVDEPVAREAYSRGIFHLRRIVEDSKGSAEALAPKLQSWLDADHAVGVALQSKNARRLVGGKFVPVEAPKVNAEQVNLALQAASLGRRFYASMRGYPKPTVNGEEIRMSNFATTDPYSAKARIAMERRRDWKPGEPNRYEAVPIGAQWSKVRRMLGEVESSERVDKTTKSKTGEQLAAAALRARMREWERSLPAEYERKGGKPIAIRRPDDYLKAFGLRAVEFGNWMDDTSSKQHVERCAEALSDLADILGIPAKSVSLNGRLAIAFGARGQGNTGFVTAAAHYEPHKVVINLTKNAGSGSLGHEWGHFLDHTIHRVATGNPKSVEFESGSPSKAPDPVAMAVKSIMDIINKGNGSIEYVANPESITDRASYWAWDKQAQLPEDQRKGPQEFLDDFMRRYPQNPVGKTRQIADYLANKTGVTTFKLNMPSSEYRARMERADTGTSKYYSLPHEMFTRCFDAYLVDKMKAAGRRNNYLVAAWKSSESPDAPFPQGEERKQIDAAFDRLFDAIKATDMLLKAVSLTRCF